MTAPTKASLKRELRAMTKRAEEAENLAAVLREDLCDAKSGWDRALAAGAEAERGRLAAIDLAARHVNENAALKEAARPVVAYMDKQWPGSVGPELRRLKELCK